MLTQLAFQILFNIIYAPMIYKKNGHGEPEKMLISLVDKLNKFVPINMMHV